jgi:glycosyltransferase involved in cell wall biosynthesis
MRGVLLQSFPGEDGRIAVSIEDPMSRKALTRRIQLSLAPPNSRWGKWFRYARQTSPASLALRILPSFITKPLKKSIHRRRQARLVPLQAQLRSLIQQHDDVEQVVIFPPSLDWNTPLFQRPQQLAVALAHQGALVFYIQPQASQQGEPFRRLQNRLYVCNVPVATFEVLKSPLVYILTWNLGYLRVFDEPQVLYDYVDDIGVCEGDPVQLKQEHDKLVRSARLVITTAERLYRKVLPLRTDAILCPNGVDYDRFAVIHQPTNTPPPSDLASILATGKPSMGYYGALARWFDYELLSTVANRRPDISFVLIGPDFDNTLHAHFLETPNVYWLGAKLYAELPDYLRYFDMAMIPFQLNEITHSTSPLKLFEYMAGGKPVVITPMQESMRYEGVLVAVDAEDFSTKIDQALRLKTDPDYLRLIDRVARQNTWDIRARQILDALQRQ